MPEVLHPGVYIEEVPSTVASIEGVDTSTTAIVGRAPNGPTYVRLPVSSLAEFERAFCRAGARPPLWWTVRDFFANGGTRAIVVRVGRKGLGDGLRALERGPRFGLLVLAPPSRRGHWPASDWNAAAALCERRRAFLIVDPPCAWRSAADVALTPPGSTSSNAAVYFPRLLDTAPSGRRRALAPSGAVAGVIARTDAQRGVWKAPAGTDAAILGSEQPCVTLAEHDIEALTNLSVNAIRSLPTGTVVWGARTLGASSQPDWKYVPVRRLALFLEESIERGIEWAVFEPNGEPLWTRIRQSVTAFLLDLWRAGALQGSKPEHAFSVRCDASTLGDIEVGFAPLRPAEFVVLRFRTRVSRDE